VIVDSSAIVSIIVGEADAEALHDILIKQKGHTKISAANYLETGIVVDGKRNPALSNRLDFLLSRSPKPRSPVRPTAISAGVAAILPSSISAIALLTP
jgi:uncharacterized protein with PIN domain